MCPAASANPAPATHWAGSRHSVGTRSAGQGAFRNSVPWSPARLAGVGRRGGSMGRGVSERLSPRTSGTRLAGSPGRAVHPERWRPVHVLPPPRAWPATLTRGPGPWRPGLLQLPGRPSWALLKLRPGREVGGGRGEGGLASQARAQASRGLPWE